MVFLVANVSQPGVTLAAGLSKMYWTDAGTGKIQQANLDGSGLEDLVTTVTRPRGIALDVSGGNRRHDTIRSPEEIISPSV